MIARVITIKGHPESEAAAERCIASADSVGIAAETHDAVTPDRLDEFHRRLGLDPLRGDFSWSESFSKPGPVVACFLSHFSLWALAVMSGDPVLVLEHDAVFDAPVPEGTDRVCSFGRPSFGRYSDAKTEGFHPAFSKAGGNYLGGAHAYVVTPKGAGLLVTEARKGYCATDMFLSRKRFPWLQEYWPWPVRADDTFSTIQREEGCKAKHNYGRQYKML